MLIRYTGTFFARQPLMRNFSTMKKFPDVPRSSAEMAKIFLPYPAVVHTSATCTLLLIRRGTFNSFPGNAWIDAFCSAIACCPPFISSLSLSFPLGSVQSSPRPFSAVINLHSREKERGPSYLTFQEKVRRERIALFPPPSHRGGIPMN